MSSSLTQTIRRRSVGQGTSRVSIKTGRKPGPVAGGVTVAAARDVRQLPDRGSRGCAARRGAQRQRLRNRPIRMQHGTRPKVEGFREDVGLEVLPGEGEGFQRFLHDIQWTPGSEITSCPWWYGFAVRYVSEKAAREGLSLWTGAAMPWPALPQPGLDGISQHNPTDGGATGRGGRERVERAAFSPVACRESRF